MTHEVCRRAALYREGEYVMKTALLAVVVTLAITGSGFAGDLGNFSSNPYDPNSTSNPYGAGSPK